MTEPADHLRTVGDILDDLRALGFEPVLVGGMALVVLGSRRVTRDFDFVMANPGDQLDPVIGVFYDRGLELASRISEAGDVTATIESRRVAAIRMRIDKPATVYFVNPETGLRIDLLFDFPEAAAALAVNATRRTIASSTFLIASEADLLRLKQIARAARSAAGDTEDIAFLESRSTSPESAIRDALHRHDAAEVGRLLSAHSELRQRINDPVFAFDSPAIVAYANDAAMVAVLLDAGADPNRKSDWWAGGFHALYSATGEAADRLLAAGAVMDACAAAHLDRPDVLKKMIAADPACVHERGGDGQTPLHFAASTAVIDVLLDAGADIDARDVDHRSTPAEWMLDRRRGAGRYALAQYLAARGAATDIFLAAALGLTDRARALLSADPGVLNLRTGRGDYGEKPPSSYHIYFWTIGDGLTALDVATQFEQRDTLDALLAAASVSQRLLAACRQADEAAARTIIQAHPGIIRTLTPDEQRAIADAAWNGHARAVALMLDLGFDLTVTGQDSGTPLHLAAWEGSPDTVAVILRHPDARALIAKKDAHHGGTPLGWCCHGSLHGNPNHDHAGVARLLLAAGARPDDIQEASPAVMAVLKN